MLERVKEVGSLGAGGGGGGGGGGDTNLEQMGMSAPR